jgi:hypothetical protein
VQETKGYGYFSHEPAVNPFVKKIRIISADRGPEMPGFGSPNRLFCANFPGDFYKTGDPDE